MKLKDKIALITGGSRGIGAATARLLAAEGASVVIDYFVSDYEPDALENATTLVAEIVENGGEAVCFAADVADEEQVKALVAAVLERYGRIDILVNNAGIVYDLPIEDRTPEQWHATFNTNLLGVYLLSKHVTPHMKRQQSGKIVNMSSTSGLDAFNPESMDYDASKAGIIAMTKNFAKVLAPYATVNAIAPGWVDTDMNKDLPTDFVDNELTKIYLRRFARPDEIARIVLFLASDDASYVNGSVIIADGGRGY